MRPWRTTQCLAGLMAALMAVTAVGAQDYGDRLLFADGLYSRRMLALAVREYADLLKTFPDGPSNDAVTFRLAECLRLQGDGASAARFYDQVVAQYRESPFRLRAAYRRARLYADAGDDASAVAHYRVILAQNPPPDLAAAAQFYLGESWQRQGNVAEAAKAFGQVESAFPDSAFMVFALMKQAELHRLRWLTLTAANDDGAAAAAAAALAGFEKVLRRPDAGSVAPEALFQSAWILFQQRNYARSAERYRQLLRDYPDDERAGQALLQAAWSALKAGLYAEARTAAVQGLEDPDRRALADEWLYIKANSERQLMQHDQAVETYRRLLAQCPESRYADTARYETASTFFQSGRYRQAVAEAEQIRMLPEHRVDVCWLLAESYAALEQPSEAIQYYRLVIRDAPGTDRARDALYRLAYQLQKQEAYPEASRFYRELASSYPDDALAPQALFASAFCQSAAGAHEEAVRDWRSLAQSYPEHPMAEEALYQKAMGEIRLGRRTDAAASFEDLRRRFETTRFLGDSWYWQGMLHVEQAAWAEAETALQTALRVASREDLRREIMFQLGLVLQKRNQPDASARLLQELVASPLSGKFPPALLEWLANWHGAQGDPARMGEAAALLAQSPEPAWAQAGWVLAGRAHQDAGRTKEAEMAFEQALGTGAASSYAPEAALRLGALALDRKQAPEARRFFQQAAEQADSAHEAVAIRARAYMGLGRAAIMAGNPDAASRYFMSVAILYDDDDMVPESLFLAAQAFDRLERDDERAKAVAELDRRFPDHEWTRKAREAWPI